MTKQSVSAAGDSPTNEELVFRFQSGDGNSALMLVCARLRHVAGTQWGNKKYMNMKHLEAALEDVSMGKLIFYSNKG